MEVLEFALKVVTVIPREESVQQILVLADAMPICNYQINRVAVSWLYIAEDSSQGWKGCSFTAFPPPTPWRSWRTWAASLLQRRIQPAQPLGRKCWISASSDALVTSPFHQALLTSLCYFTAAFHLQVTFCHQDLCQLYCQVAEIRAGSSSQDSDCKDVIKCERGI